ncbi:MAG: acyloxyacyl hydrolase, partial [Anaerolineae bacterium]
MEVKATSKKKALLSMGMGTYNVTGQRQKILYQAEYKWKPPAYDLRPQAGIFTTNVGATYVYGGVGYDFFIGKRVVLTPSFSPGIYFKGKGKDLGFPVEFRSAIELAFRFKNEGRLGAEFYHISNAHLSRRNPGVNILVGFYS